MTKALLNQLMQGMQVSWGKRQYLKSEHISFNDIFNPIPRVNMENPSISSHANSEEERKIIAAKGVTVFCDF